MPKNPGYKLLLPPEYLQQRQVVYLTNIIHMARDLPGALRER